MIYFRNQKFLMKSLTDKYFNLLQFIKYMFVAGVLVLTTTQCAVRKNDRYKQLEQARYGKNEANERNTTIEKNRIELKDSKNVLTENIVDYAETFIGIPYADGGKNPETGFDCSGFISYVYKEFGLKLSPSSSQMSLSGENVDLGDVKKGDLMFFTDSDEKKRAVGHVALVVNNKSGKIDIIHSTSSRGIITETYNTSKYWTLRFLFAKRIINP